MKKRYFTSLLVIGAMAFGALVGCNQPNNSQPSASNSIPSGDSTSGGDNSSGGNTSADSSANPSSSSSSPVVQFNFSVSLMSGGTTINKGQTDTVEITESNNDGTVRQYSFSSNNQTCATVDGNGVISALSKGTVRITVTERTAGLFKAR